jgi:hypothetical protein
MKLTPQAMRLISIGANYLGRPDVVYKWRRWADRNPEGRVTPEIAETIVHSLTALEGHIVRRMDAPLDDDLRADAINDLGYIRAIEGDLLHENPNLPLH